MSVSRLNRRSFIGRVVGATAALAGGAAGVARAQVSDHDAGAMADNGGMGRGPTRTRRSGITDADAGSTVDRAGFGRGPRNSGGQPIEVGPSPQATAPCRRFNGAFHLVQANNIEILLELRDYDGQISGTADYLSSTMGPVEGETGLQIHGVVEGQTTENSIELRIAWRARGYPQGESDPVTYQETGIYSGSIGGGGAVTGQTHPFERPNARTTWFLRGYAVCR